MSKPFFVGKRSLQIHSRRKVERKLVGFSFPKGYTGNLPADCQLIFDREKIVGRVTSIAERTTLGYPIGLAFVTPDLAAPGTALHIRVSPRELVDAQVTKLPFYDPENARQI